MDIETTYLRQVEDLLTGKPQVIQAIAFSKKSSQWLLIDTTEKKVTTELSSGLASDIVRVWTDHGQLKI